MSFALPETRDPSPETRRYAFSTIFSQFSSLSLKIV